ncbi:malto-oligosyltrehalose synthase [soil metagenome]
MKRPDTTYRLQLSPNFTFNDLDRILDYLDDLGISTIYSAPFFQAREGSMHGYDVINPLAINGEIGDLDEFREICKRLHIKEMTWLQDIVPNHMAFDSKNPWLRDIFELGPLSRFYNFFDINWEFKGLHKVMAPFLGDCLEAVLDRNEMELHLDEQGIFLKYFENLYPLSMKTYEKILAEAGNSKWLTSIKDNEENIEQWREIKRAFLLDIAQNQESREKINKALAEINISKARVKEILDLQYFLPTHWQQTEKEINYRRFFTINGLICLKMEDPVVFETYHLFIKELVEEVFINGLRIDHIDGLFDPEAYLIQLRKVFGNDIYIIVEKILEADEKLPRHWPSQGTTGYDFLAHINHLFTQHSNEEHFTECYEHISPRMPDYETLVFQKKLFILKNRMGGELENLWSYLRKNNLLPAEDPSEQVWKEALGAFLAAFPVYRVYPQKFPLKSRQVQIIDTAYHNAVEIAPQSIEELKCIRNLYVGKTDKEKDKALYFLKRCQQFSGPLTAKGVEDTSFYIYNRLVAHNEVGDSPHHFGIPIEVFHEKMQIKTRDFPLSLNATATHDTKRGEDGRMRLLVLSEIPEEWFSRVDQWREINLKYKKNNIPDNNEEYFIYQTLISGMPFNEEEDFLERTFEYLQKVLREAKVHSNWANPSENYENDVFQFVKNIYSCEEFRKSFDPFHKKVAGLGAIKSLGQSLIKITAPGIPDIYQGTELWDFSYVDPDNRRPVDYGLRMNYMADFRSFSSSNIKKKLNSLKGNFKTGKIKMFTIYKALSQRRKDKDIYQKGDYIPLKLLGEESNKFISYARILGEEWRIVVVPVLVNELFNHGNLKPIGEKLNDLYIDLPDNSPSEWDFIFTGESLLEEEKIPLGDALSTFPVILLKSRKQTWN